MIGSEPADRIVAACLARPRAALDLLSELAALDAPSGRPPLLDRTASLLERRLLGLGATVDRIPTTAGTHLEGRLGAGDGSRIVVLAHYDTVWAEGTAAARPFAVRDGIAIGPGVFDMRAGIAASLTALAVLRDLGELHRPVTVLLTCDEEVGSLTSEAEIVRVGRDAACVLIPEPPLAGGRLKTTRKGVITVTLRVGGRAAHAGLDPERGISAISSLASLVREVESLASPSEGTTVNVGVVAGGTRANVVAAEATAEVDVRVSTMAEYDRIVAAMTALRPDAAGASLEVEIVHGRRPMERTEPISQMVERAAAIARLGGIALDEGAAGGASDGNFLAPLGVGVLDGLGADGGGAHALDEHVVLESLEQRVVLLALLLALL